MRESAIESACCRHVRRKSGLAIKLQSLATRGVPDRLFVFPPRKTLFVEFKRPGGKTTALQEAWLARIRACGHDAWVIDDVSDFQRRLADWLER